METAKWCVSNKHYKDVVSYFNKNYIATDKFSREVGKKLANLQRKRENSDYDDFYIASLEETEKQIEAADYIIGEIQKYLQKQ